MRCGYSWGGESPARFAGAAILLALALLAGCESEPITGPTMRHEPVATVSTDDFETGIKLVEQLNEFEPEQAMARASYHLNRWLAEQPASKDWIQDPMIGRTLGELADAEPLQNLPAKRISKNDIRFLQETTWMRDVAKWAARAEHPDLVERQENLVKDLDADAAEQLRTALALFDWTVRNIQLDPFPAEPPPQVLQAIERQPGPKSLAARGVPGPGYTMQPWEVMLFGHGDAWHRARVFILLARQHVLDAVVLGTGPKDEPHKPWAVGVRVGQQLYLFDPLLGLPLPGPSGTGIATLHDVRTDPELLQALDVGTSVRYPVRHEDLQHVTAYIDASSHALSHRMKILQDRLVGQLRMVLCVEPNHVAQRVRECSGVDDVAVWPIPIETELFAQQMAEFRRQDSRAQAMHQRETMLFTGLSGLSQARQLYFRHEFDRLDDDRPGAMVKLMETRLSDEEIELIKTSPKAQALIGLQRARGESDESWQARVALAHTAIREGKNHASYWLGLIHYESGDYENAINWFDRRTLQASPNSPWRDGARYNLGRSYEALGKYREARETYLLDESPQRHGNLLRARQIRLSKLAGQASGEEQ